LVAVGNLNLEELPRPARDVAEQSEINIGWAPVQTCEDLLSLIETCEPINWTPGEINIRLVLNKYCVDIKAAQLLI
jgi:hypothetical protein